MVIGGNNYEHTAEVMDLSDLTKVCAKPPPTLEPVKDSIAVILDGKLTVCGNNHYSYNGCQSYSKASKSWEMNPRATRTDVSRRVMGW